MEKLREPDIINNKMIFSDEDSLDFQDLHCQSQREQNQQQTPKTVAKQDVEFYKLKQHENTLNLMWVEKQEHIIKIKDKQILFLKNQIKNLNEANEQNLSKYLDSLSNIVKLQEKIIQLINVTNFQLQTNQKLQNQINQYQQKIKLLQEKMQYISNEQRQLKTIIKQNDTEIKKFISSRCDLQIDIGKQTKTIIQQAINQLQNKLLKIDLQIHQLFSMVEDSEDNINETNQQYNHKKCLKKIIKIGQYLIKTKQQIYNLQNRNMKLIKESQEYSQLTIK